MGKIKTILFKLGIISLTICILLTSTLNHAWAQSDEEALKNKVDKYIKQDEDTAAALATIVIKEDEVIFYKIKGYADMERGIKADKDSVFEWGSSSKILVWISAIQLMEEGKINLDADIDTYLPENFSYPKSYEDSITMLHLMNHSAGFDDTYTDLAIHNPAEIITLRQVLDKSDTEQEFYPGEIVAYSNYGTTLAAYIVELVSGIDYQDYVKENILEPLGMKYTSVAPDMSDNPWVKDQRDKIQAYNLDNKLINPNRYVIPMYPAGSAVGTVDDLAILLTELLSKDGSNLFKDKETINLMFEPTAYYPSTNIPRLAHGLWSLPSKSKVYGHGGNTPGFSSTVYMDRENGLGTIVMTNQASESKFTLGIPELVFGRVVVDNSAIDLEDSSQWKGIYQPARMPYHGFSKLFSLVNRITIKEEGNFNLLSGEIIYNQDNPGIYIANQDFSLYSLDVYSNHEKLGKILSSAYGDLVEIPLYLHVFEWGLAIAAIIAMLFSLIYLIVILIKKLLGSHSRLNKSNSITLVLNILNLLLFANLVLMIKKTLSMTTYDSLKVNFIINIIYMVSVLPLLGYGIYKRKEYQSSKKQKLVFFITIIFTIIILGNLLYWEFYH